ncbi:transglycosylase SLT domain-containing protein [Rugamonas aquatica]|uniref:Transglycosylase SLT domain-containing protein n=1 Tax=Rugamonas aquatica TaxID=2743357 RepID=A0A6A7N6U5_9BURK|nr:transglycosylase SLT domain-containing protein [Rugamonas aquatica]MQA40602.1 transglycosylase SLT domain-containing protein [Rugamonas aquatica]
MLRYLVIVLLLLRAGSACACWDRAGHQHGIAPLLLYAVAQAESGANPRLVHHNDGPGAGTRDIGAMQINSGNLPALRGRGINEARLLDLCTNVDVGAGILAERIQRFGLSWEAVGAYNASCVRLTGDACRRARSAYAWRVYRQLQRLRRGSAVQLAAYAGSQPATVAGPLLQVSLP